jgi:hypothetical protein
VEIASLKKWLDAYGRAWEGGDPDAFAGLFTEDATYYETPFDEPIRGRAGIHAYLSSAAGAQRDVRFWHEPYSTGEVGVARWGASFVRVPSGVKVRLDGVFAVRFDDGGECYEFREWWHRAES